jgi:hypothetical protein
MSVWSRKPNQHGPDRPAWQHCQHITTLTVTVTVVVRCPNRRCLFSTICQAISHLMTSSITSQPARSSAGISLQTSPRASTQISSEGSHLSHQTWPQSWPSCWHHVAAGNNPNELSLLTTMQTAQSAQPATMQTTQSAQPSSTRDSTNDTMCTAQQNLGV